MPLKIRVYTDDAGEGRWSAIDGNNKVIADSSEGYDDEDNALDGFYNLADHIRRSDYEVVRDD